MRVPRREYDATLPTAALGDIAFLLLIFFVLLARVQDDSHIQTELAKTSTVEKAESPVARVALDKENRLFINGLQIGIDALAPELSDMLGDKPAGARQVICRIDRDVTATYFQPVLDGISEAGGELLEILQEQRSPK